MFPPEEQFLKIGDDLHLNCTLTENTRPDITEFSVSDIRIDHSNVTLHSRAISIYHGSANTLEVILRNVSLRDTGMYFCFYGNDSHIRSMTYVSVGRKYKFSSYFL